VSRGERPKRVTIWVVPDGGSGPSRQLVLSLQQIQLVTLALVVLYTLAAAGSALGLGTLPRALAYGELEAENLALKARLLELEGKLDSVDREIRRLRLYEEQLQAIDPVDLPGFGPVDPVAGVAIDPDPKGEAAPGGDTGSPGDALDDLGESDLITSPVASLRLDAAEARADELLRKIRLAELEMGQFVETAESYRARSMAIPEAWPLDGVLTSGFGWRRSPFNRRWKFHFGIDVSAPIGTVIRAPAAGVVVTAQYHTGYGRMLEIDHGYDVVTRYAHNARLLVGIGETVAGGQPISTVGMTGATTGPHLHYEIYVEGQPIDPLEHMVAQDDRAGD